MIRRAMAAVGWKLVKWSQTTETYTSMRVGIPAADRGDNLDFDYEDEHNFGERPL